MPSNSSNSINFLNPILSPKDAWTVMYEWVTKVGRYLLVVAEILVLAVFFSRFVLDRKNNILTESINKIIDKDLGLESTRIKETKFRTYQDLFEDINTIAIKQDINSYRLSTILDSISSTIRLKTITFSKDRVDMTLEADSLEDMGKYTASLHNNPLYSDVNSSLSKSGETNTNIVFTVSFTINEE